MKSPWLTKKLGEVCEIRTGKKDVDEGNPEGEYPFFTCAREISYSDTYSFDTEAILVAGNGDVGATKYYKGKFEAYQRTYVLDQFKEGDIRFIYYFILAGLKRKLLLEKSGSTMPYVRKGDLASFQISLPPLSEQQKIVYVLDSIKEGISVQEKIIEKTKELKRAMMVEIFNSKFKIQKSKSKFKIKKLFTITKVKYGKAKPLGKGHIPVVGSGGVYAYTDKALIYKPTIIVGRKGTAGKLHLMVTPCWPSDTTFYLDLNLKVVNPKYLYEILSTKIISGEEAKTTLPSLKRETLENIEVVLPSISEQHEIAEILQTIDQKIEIEQKKKALYEELFKTMLNKLMSGKIKIDNFSFEEK